jgi:hypothetical protein
MSILGAYAGKEPRKFFRLLDTVGDGSGVKNAAVDHSGAATAYKIKPHTSADPKVASEVFDIQKLNIEIEGAGIKADLYGGVTALSNGIQILILDASGVKIDLTNGVTIKKNYDYARLGEVKESVSGATTNFVTVSIDLSKLNQYNCGVRLDGSKGELLEVLLHDNFSGLSSHYFVAQGEIVSDGPFLVDTVSA